MPGCHPQVVIEVSVDAIAILMSWSRNEEGLVNNTLDYEEEEELYIATAMKGIPGPVHPIHGTEKSPIGGGELVCRESA